MVFARISSPLRLPFPPLCVALLLGAIPAQVDVAAGEVPTIELRTGAHRELRIEADLQRVAVGDPAIAGVEVVTSGRLLLLGKAAGSTTLTLWRTDGEIEVLGLRVRPDLGLLERSLRRIEPGISVEIAPDRDALVLLGEVADLPARDAAEAIALAYLEAGRAAPPPAVRADGESRVDVAPLRSSRVVNLLTVRELPMTIEARIAEAVREIGGPGVVVRRIQRGAAADDAADVLVLEGTVPDQVALTRTLQLTARIFLGRGLASDDVAVVADEAGALVREASQNIGAVQGAGQVATSGVLRGSQQALRALQNRVEANLGRATVVELGGGRILSFLEVEDLPTVRVAIRLYEVDRSELLAVQSEFGSLVGDLDQGSLAPPGLADSLRGPGLFPRTGSSASGVDVQNALGFLADSGPSEQFQLAGSRFALDVVFRALESAGIARQLSSPNLTVLSGERAQFQVGGEIPINQAFTPAFGGGDGQGTFTSVDFREFGVQLAVRPLVGHDGSVTLDLSTLVAQPDGDLTAFVRDATGSDLGSTAFSTRSLLTSARLADGDALLVGGLVSNATSRNESKVPLLGDLPLLGWLFRSRGYDTSSRELFVLVSPIVVRDPVPGADLWEQPSSFELLSELLPEAGNASSRDDASPTADEPARDDS